MFEMITGLRMNHAYIRPGGVAQDLPAGRHRQDPRHGPGCCARACASSSCCSIENPILKGRTVDVGYLDLTGCMALGITGPVLRSTGLPHDLRKSQPYCGYETYDFEVITRDTVRRLRPAADPASTRCTSRCKIVEQCVDRLQATPGPVMVEDKKIAWPAQLAIGGDGMGNSLDHIRDIMGTSMEALIHHFKLVTEGFRVPAGPGVRRGRVAQGRARRATWSPTAARAPTARTSATRRSTTCRPRPRCARAARSPTSSSPSPRSTP